MALEWSSLPFTVETDSVEAATMISNPLVDRSQYTALVQEISAMMRGDRQIKVKAIKRECNLVSHELAKIGRVEVKTAVWLRSGLGRVVKLCALDHTGDRT